MIICGFQIHELRIYVILLRLYGIGLIYVCNEIRLNISKCNQCVKESKDLSTNNKIMHITTQVKYLIFMDYLSGNLDVL